MTRPCSILQGVKRVKKGGPLDRLPPKRSGKGVGALQNLQFFSKGRKKQTNAVCGDPAAVFELSKRADRALCVDVVGAKRSAFERLKNKAAAERRKMDAEG